MIVLQRLQNSRWNFDNHQLSIKLKGFVDFWNREFVIQVFEYNSYFRYSFKIDSGFELRPRWTLCKISFHPSTWSRIKGKRSICQFGNLQHFDMIDPVVRICEAENNPLDQMSSRLGIEFMLPTWIAMHISPHCSVIFSWPFLLLPCFLLGVFLLVSLFHSAFVALYCECPVEAERGGPKTEATNRRKTRGEEEKL